MLKYSCFRLFWVEFMLKGLPILVLPKSLSFAKFSTKLAVGLVLLLFLLDYHPVLNFPPVQRSIVKAQSEQTQTINASALPFQFQLPHPGYMTTPFSSFHPGIDIATGLGMPIHSIAPGTVSSTGFDFWGLGLNVMVEHASGYKSIYAHMGKVYVQKGQRVEANTTLGEVGLTGHTSGPHTHLEVSKNDARINPQLVLPSIRLTPTQAHFIASESAKIVKR